MGPLLMPLSYSDMSLGGGMSSLINNAVDAAVLKGVVVVSSGGNDGDLACKKSPASAESAITVGAVDRYNNRPSYSNYGSCIDIFGYVARLLVLYYDYI